MRSFTLTFPYAPPDVLRKNTHGSSHWSKKKEASDSMKEWVMLGLRTLGYSPSDVHTGAWAAAEVQYISFFCGKPIDATEFATGMAPALDCLLPERIQQRKGIPYVVPGIGLLGDDGPEFVKCLPTKYVKVKTRKQVQTRMIVTEIESTDWLWKGETE